MAVYTHVGAAALAEFLADFDLGPETAFQGIPQGVENTNYALTTPRGKFVLTLFERRVREADLPFFMAAMAHLRRSGVPSPEPIGDRQGHLIKRLAGRPAAILRFLDGAPKDPPAAEDCRRAGQLSAQLHRGAEGFPLRRANALGLAAWRALAASCAKSGDAALTALIDDELRYLSDHWPHGLPCGLIHADLFPDNVLFRDGAVSGVIDFYFSCTDSFAYDLALAANAWASSNGAFDRARARALFEGYRSARLLAESERRAMPILLRGAALRILLTRLYDRLHPVEGAIVAMKDPLEYRDLLEFHRRGGANEVWDEG
jgi:homoserine kinase type II